MALPLVPLPPFALPPAPGGNVPRPPAPANPPTMTDVGEAQLYVQKLIVSREGFRRGSGVLPGGPSEDDVGRAVMYEKSIAEAHNPAAAAPAWAQGLIATVTALYANMNALTVTVNNLIEVVHDTRIEHLQVTNSLLADGHGFPF